MTDSEESVQTEFEEYCRSSVSCLDQIINYYYSPMLLECKNDINFPLNETEIHQIFTNLGFVLNWNRKFYNSLKSCRDSSIFIDFLQQFLSQPQFGTESEFGIICTEYAKNYPKIVILLDKSESNSLILKEFLKRQFEKYPSNTIQSGLIWPIKAPVNIGMFLHRLNESTCDVVSKKKIFYIKRSVNEVAIEVNKTFPLDTEPFFGTYDKIFVMCFGLSVAVAIYLYYRKGGVHD